MLQEIRRELPDESLLYVGDSAFCPYGSKTTEVIIERVRLISDWLIARGAKLIVIACNSATIAAVETLRSELLIPIVGMEPGLKPACALSKSHVVGVLATETSLAGEKFHRLLNHHAKDDIKVITRPCPRFVELVEAGMLTGPDVQAAVEAAIFPLLRAGADTLVLGCTHYSFLAPAIREVAGPEVQLIDTGAAVARRVRQQLEHYELLSATPEGDCQLFTTDKNGNTVAVAPKAVKQTFAGIA